MNLRIKGFVYVQHMQRPPPHPKRATFEMSMRRGAERVAAKRDATLAQKGGPLAGGNSRFFKFDMAGDAPPPNVAHVG